MRPQIHLKRINGACKEGPPTDAKANAKILPRSSLYRLLSFLNAIEKNIDVSEMSNVSSPPQGFHSHSPLPYRDFIAVIQTTRCLKGTEAWDALCRDVFVQNRVCTLYTWMSRVRQAVKSVQQKE